jgi:hypothetical protein
MKDNGGSAFPDIRRLEILSNINIDSPTKEVIYGESKGMTLRDYFAAMAVQGKSTGFLEVASGYYEAEAKSAYLLADAMIAERNKP